MSIEAMKQALNALDYYASFATGKERGFTFPIITALRQAIEQAEKQEPVAYVAVINGEIDWNADYPFSNEPFTCFDDENAVPLYTSPPRKEWVSLTDEEITKAYEVSGHCQTLRSRDAFAVFSLARAIEAALKDKNHD